ncbi:hypothetical protein CDAR_448971 [Caerostris darwini]|uniref:Uncharacterized protein n=1 Tax=Caerostris darwini TaxID=1538125 RepID=A0AAV4WDQ2_9ARAC|nr:hypothetical protein CDAR_448971 [Caerostris darwini]
MAAAISPANWALANRPETDAKRIMFLSERTRREGLNKNRKPPQDPQLTTMCFHQKELISFARSKKIPKILPPQFAGGQYQNQYQKWCVEGKKKSVPPISMAKKVLRRGREGGK